MTPIPQHYRQGRASDNAEVGNQKHSKIVPNNHSAEYSLPICQCSWCDRHLGFPGGLEVHATHCQVSVSLIFLEQSTRPQETPQEKPHV